VRRAIVVCVLLFACGAAACIIGPKQDDPLSDRDLTDAGAVLDVNGGLGAEAAPPGGDTSPRPDDAGSLDSTDAVAGDAGPDAMDATDASEAADAMSDAAEGG
jgi:hypothetical protein